MYFDTKSYLKSNRNHTAKQTLNSTKSPSLSVQIYKDIHDKIHYILVYNYRRIYYLDAVFTCSDRDSCVCNFRNSALVYHLFFLKRVAHIIGKKEIMFLDTICLLLPFYLTT